MRWDRKRVINVAAFSIVGAVVLFVAVAAGLALWGRFHRSPTAEATVTVVRISKKLVATLEAATPAGLADDKVPDVATADDWTPVTPCCKQVESGKCDGAQNASAWDQPGWRAIGFEGIQGGFRYQYRFARTESGYLVEARGDLDCDGKYSLWSLPLTRNLSTSRPMNVEHGAWGWWGGFQIVDGEE